LSTGFPGFHLEEVSLVEVVRCEPESVSLGFIFFELFGKPVAANDREVIPDWSVAVSGMLNPVARFTGSVAELLNAVTGSPAGDIVRFWKVELQVGNSDREKGEVRPFAFVETGEVMWPGEL
jgi:hypothetical protein